MPFHPVQPNQVPGQMSMLPRITPEQETENPDFSDTMAAAVRQENTLASNAAFQEGKPVMTAQEQADYMEGKWDYRPAIPKGNEDYEIEYAKYGVSQRHVDWVTSNIDRERRDRKVLDESGVSGFLSQMFAAMTSPEQAPLYAVEGALLLKSGVLTGRRTMVASEKARNLGLAKESGIALGAGITSAAVAEGMLHSSQHVRTMEESGYAIAATALFAGAIPSIGRAMGWGGDEVTRYMDDLADDIVESSKSPIQSVGAAETDLLPDDLLPEIRAGYEKRITDIEEKLAPLRVQQAKGELSPAGEVEIKRLEEAATGVYRDAEAMVERSSELKHPKMAKALGQLSPAVRIATSRSHSSRVLGARLLDDPLQRVRNQLGASLGESLESNMSVFKIKTQIAFQDTTNASYKALNKLAKDNADLKMDMNQFMERLSKALRNNDVDVDGNEFITAAAKDVRAKVFTPIEARLEKLALLPREVTDQSWDVLDEGKVVSFLTAEGVTEESLKYVTKSGALKKGALRRAPRETINMLVDEGLLETKITLPAGDESYLHRMWNFDEIELNGGEFDRAVGEYIVEESDAALMKSQERMIDTLNKRITGIDETLEQFEESAAAKSEEQHAAQLQRYQDDLADNAEQMYEDLKAEYLPDPTREDITPEERAHRQALFDAEVKKIGANEAWKKGVRRPVRDIINDLEAERGRTVKARDDLVGELGEVRQRGYEGAAGTYRAKGKRAGPLMDGMREIRANAPKIAGDVRRKILNTDPDTGFGKSLTITAGPLKGRTLDIPSKRIEKFLENDLEVLTNAYSSKLAYSMGAAQLFQDADTVARKAKHIGNEANAGTKVITEQITEAVRSYEPMIAAAKTQKEKTSLIRERDRVARDLEAEAQVLQGRFKRPDNPEGFWPQAAQTIKQFNIMTMLGMVAIASLPDIGQIIARRGFKVFTRPINDLVNGMSQIKIDKKMGRRLGVASELSGATRLEKMYMLDNTWMPMNNTNKRMGWLTNKFVKATGLEHWNRMLKEVVATSYIDDIALDAIAHSKGKLKPDKVARYAQGGLSAGDMMEIGKLMKGAEKVDGVHFPNPDTWPDEALASRFKSAVRREVDTAIVTPGAGDLPLVSRHQLGQIILQFKSFAMSANNRVILANLDDMTAQKMTGMMIMMALGNLAYTAREIAKGNEPDYSDPYSRFMREGIDRSGLLAVWGDVNAISSKMTGGKVDLYKLLGAQEAELSRYASRNVLGAMLGVSAGRVGDISKLAYSVANGDVAESDLRAMRRMVIFQNHALLYQGFNKIEEAMK